MLNLKCQECGADAVMCESHYVCPNCGLVIEQLLVPPLYHVSSDEPIRGAWVYPETQTGSYIDYKDAFTFKDLKGNVLPPRSQSIYKRLKLKALHDKVRVLSATHYRALYALKRVTENLGLPVIVRERAAKIYRRIVRDTKVSNNILLVAACLLHAVREQKNCALVTLTEITEAFTSLGYRVTPKKLLRASFIVRKIVGAHQRLRRSEEYLPRAINTLLESESVLHKLKEKRLNVTEYKVQLTSFCSKILSEVKVNERGGRRPYTFLAAVIYCADKLLALKRGHPPILTQKLVAEILGVAEYSLRDHYNTILKPRYVVNTTLIRQL
ncbi:MAG: hypothetical protein QXK94_07010 [Candidatus Jordarchaeales archaeon]